MTEDIFKYKFDFSTLKQDPFKINQIILKEFDRIIKKINDIVKETTTIKDQFEVQLLADVDNDEFFQNRNLLFKR